MNWHWLRLVASVAPVVLSCIPGAAPLAPIVATAIQTAEALPGATRDQKLSHAAQLVGIGAEATNALAGHEVIPVDVAAHVARVAISTIVDTANRIHAAHAPAALG